MGARTPPVSGAMSSRARSVDSYYPFYPPPLSPQASEIHGGYSGFGTVPLSQSTPQSNAGVVNSQWNRWGDRTRYTIGGLVRKVFAMRATGQVESSAFQPVLNMPLQAQFNDHLYRAAKGYPRNLGLSEKVPTLPQEALGNNPWGRMQPRTQITRNVFTRRNYATPNSVPAQPQAR